MQQGDSSQDNVLSFEEFVDYATDHERKLWIVFKSVDTDGSSKFLFKFFQPQPVCQYVSSPYIIHTN